MKENLELERSDMVIDRDLETDGQQIAAYIETLFDVDKKFNIHTDVDEDMWLNIYAIYDPLNNSLEIECHHWKPDGVDEFYYTPTPDEAEIVKEIIAEKIEELHGQTPIQFLLEEDCGEQIMGGIL